MILFDNVTYTYPFQDRPAVRDISFSVNAGEIVLCTGASGCGKSTLMRLCNGLCPQYFKGDLQGTVRIDGVSTTGPEATSVNAISSLAGTLFQDPEQQFFALNVEDEIAFAHECRGQEPDIIQQKIDAVLKQFNIEHIRNASIHELSEGQKQKLGLASLLSQKLKVLILDEPTANLDPEATLDLAQKLQELKALGLAIFVVDHRLYWLEGIADKVLVMEEGRIGARGDFSILYDDALREHYGLRAAHVPDIRRDLPNVMDNEGTTEQGLAVQNLTFAYDGQAPIFDKADIHFKAGIGAILGDNGVGKTTLARLLTGLNTAQSGQFMVHGQKVESKKLLQHVGIVLQNADHQLHMRTVLEEVHMCYALAQRLKDPQSRPSKGLAFAEETMELLALFGLDDLHDRHPQSLSGGQKQRLVIACAFAKHPQVLILDEPTSGLDGRNMRRIDAALQTLAMQNVCILVITHDLELIQNSCTYGIHLPWHNRQAHIQS
ncbi:MAG: ATP-binding cassette domain-containing protein [Pseudomonadota bacterium]